MRPLRWGLPVFALLLIAPVLVGHEADPPTQEPYVTASMGSAYLQCGVPVNGECTLLMDTWHVGGPAAEGLTTLVVELYGGPALLLLAAVPESGRVDMRITSPAGDQHDLVAFVGSVAASRSEWTTPLKAGTWAFDVDQRSVAPLAGWPGAYNVLTAQRVQVGLTFAYWGYELPADWSLFDASREEPSQTLLDNVDLSADKLPCASTSLIRGSPAGLPLSTTNAC
jgi:hypothetical protein